MKIVWPILIWIYMCSIYIFIYNNVIVNVVIRLIYLTALNGALHFVHISIGSDRRKSFLWHLYGLDTRGKLAETLWYEIRFRCIDLRRGGKPFTPRSLTGRQQKTGRNDKQRRPRRMSRKKSVFIFFWEEEGGMVFLEGKLCGYCLKIECCLCWSWASRERWI